MSKAHEENNKSGKPETSGPIGARQEYRRTGKAPSPADAMEKVPGKPTTPYKY